MPEPDSPIVVSLLDHQVPVFSQTAPNVVYAKGRRAGGTMGAARKCIDFAVSRPGLRQLWVDTRYVNIQRYVKRYFLPCLKKVKRNTWNWNGSLMVLTINVARDLPDGTREVVQSIVDFGSADRPESIEGFGYDVFWLNEAGIILRNPSLYYNTLAPMALESEAAQFWFIGAPKGKGLFHQFYMKGEDPLEPDWVAIRHTSYDNPMANRELLARFTKDMPELVYRQEILAEFVDDQSGFFRGVTDAAVAVMAEAPSPGASYVIGGDWAKQNDFTVNWVGRTDTRQGVFCERYNRLPYPEQIQRVRALSERFNHAHVVHDGTGIGDVLADDLTEAGVPNTKIVLTNPVKQDLLETLAADIEQRRTTFYPHAETVNELGVFERIMLPSGNWRLAAPEGMHDDCVIALAMMNRGFGRLSSGPVIETAPGIGAEQEREAW